MDGFKIRPLVWEDFGDWGAKASAYYQANYLIQFWKGREQFEVALSYPGYQTGFDGERWHTTLAAAKAAAQADYEARILAALEPVAALDLTDPVTVHANMLRGTIAKPTVEQIIHLYGREAFQPMIDAAVAKALEEACLAVSEHADWPEDAHGRTEQVGLFARVINAIRAITPAVTQPALEPVAANAIEAHDEQLGVWADELMADLMLNGLMDLVDHEYDTKVGARREIIAALKQANLGKVTLLEPVAAPVTQEAIAEAEKRGYDRGFANALTGGASAPDALHRSFPEAGDGRPMPPMGDELMTAGLDAEDARFVAVQLAQNGWTLTPNPVDASQTPDPAVNAPAEDAVAKGETGGETLERLGMDGAKWAAEFRTTALRLGYSDMDEGWLIGWFCNAVMAGYDRSPAPDPAAIREAALMKGALEYYADQFCEGFCQDMPDLTYTDENCERDCGGCKARSVLALISKGTAEPTEYERKVAQMREDFPNGI